MHVGVIEAGAARRRIKPVLSDLAVLAIEIAVPLAFVNLVGALTMMGWRSAFSILNIPVYDWSPVVCAVWVLLVLHYGPLFAPKPQKERGTE
jgi:hypothetical protein